jgi:hypothetical protein
MKIKYLLILFAISLVITVTYLLLTLLDTGQNEIPQSELPRTRTKLEMLNDGMRGSIIDKNGKTFHVLIVPVDDSTFQDKSNLGNTDSIINRAVSFVTPFTLFGTGAKLTKLSNTVSERSLFLFAKNYGVKNDKIAESFSKSAFIKIRSSPFKLWSAFITRSGAVGLVEEWLLPSLPIIGKVFIAITATLFVLIIFARVFDYTT